MLTYIAITDSRIAQALSLWHEAERNEFQRHYINLVYDLYAPKTAKDGKRWIKLNRGSSGVYLIDRTSPACDVWSIKAYGVPNRRLDTLDNMMSTWTVLPRIQQTRRDQLGASEVIFS